MRLLGDLARGGHQARWVAMFEVSELRNPWYLRLGWRVKDVFRPRRAAECPGWVAPRMPIHKVGTGFRRW